MGWWETWPGHGAEHWSPWGAVHPGWELRPNKIHPQGSLQTLWATGALWKGRVGAPLAGGMLVLPSPALGGCTHPIHHVDLSALQSHLVFNQPLDGARRVQGAAPTSWVQSCYTHPEAQMDSRESGKAEGRGGTAGLGVQGNGQVVGFS